MTADAKLLDVTGLAEMLNAEPSKVLEWHKRYRWPHVKIGRSVRWTPEQAEEIVRRHIVTAPAPLRQVSPIAGQTARSASRGRR